MIILGKVTKTGFQVLDSLLPRASRAGLERTFAYWLTVYGPLHFQLTAFYRYAEYKKLGKFEQAKFRRTHERQLREGKDTILPLVKTGALRDAFLHSGYTFSAGMDKLKVKWPGLPAYAYKSRASLSKGTSANKAKCLTDINDQEQAKLAQVFAAEFDRQIASGDPASRTFGRGRLLMP